MVYYALKTNMGYVRSLTTAGSLEITNKLEKDIITGNKEFLEELAVLLNKSRKVKDIKVIKVTLTESV